jgi:hypothetical protein
MKSASRFGLTSIALTEVMPRFRVMLHGEGFRSPIESGEKPFGFFATRYVDAATELEGSERAMNVLQGERKFRRFSRSLASEKVTVEQIEQVSCWAKRFSWHRGFTLFMWEGESSDVVGI